MSETINVEAIFGENVFNDSVMKERLPKSVYKKLKQTIEDGSELDPLPLRNTIPLSEILIPRVRF